MYREERADQVARRELVDCEQPGGQRGAMSALEVWKEGVIGSEPEAVCALLSMWAEGESVWTVSGDEATFEGHTL